MSTAFPVVMGILAALACPLHMVWRSRRDKRGSHRTPHTSLLDRLNARQQGWVENSTDAMHEEPAGQ